MKTYYAIIGAGGHGREVMPMLRNTLKEQLESRDVEVVFVVEGHVNEATVNGYTQLSLDSFTKINGKKYFNIAIGDSKVRQRISQVLLQHGMEPFHVIAQSAIILDRNIISDGCMISEQTIITSNVTIGRFFQANSQCNISHDCKIGDYVTLAPGVKCNGNVWIEDHAYIGAGALIKQGTNKKPLIIGEGAVVGMGAVVIDNVAPYTTVVGNPARIIRNKTQSKH